MYTQLKSWLFNEAEPDYREFAASLIPNCSNLLGVRLPKLRKKATEIAKIDANYFLKNYECIYFEELLLKGMVIGTLETDSKEFLTLISEYVPLITNWSLCDSFCAGLKLTNKHKKEVWKFLQPYLKSKKEFELRFAVVMILNYFVTDEWINKVLKALFTLKSDKYYAQMGIAWAISICMTKYFDLTLEYLKNNPPDFIILKKSVQKGCESLCLSKEQKQTLRSLLKKTTQAHRINNQTQR